MHLTNNNPTALRRHKGHRRDHFLGVSCAEKITRLWRKTAAPQAGGRKILGPLHEHWKTTPSENDAPCPGSGLRPQHAVCVLCPAQLEALRGTSRCWRPHDGLMEKVLINMRLKTQAMRLCSCAMGAANRAGSDIPTKQAPPELERNHRQKKTWVRQAPNLHLEAWVRPPKQKMRQQLH